MEEWLFPSSGHYSCIIWPLFVKLNWFLCILSRICSPWISLKNLFPCWMSCFLTLCNVCFTNSIRQILLSAPYLRQTSNFKFVKLWLCFHSILTLLCLLYLLPMAHFELIWLTGMRKHYILITSTCLLILYHVIGKHLHIDISKIHYSPRLSIRASFWSVKFHPFITRHISGYSSTTLCRITKMVVRFQSGEL